MLQMPFGTMASARLSTAAKVKISRMPGIEVKTLYSHSSASPSAPAEEAAERAEHGADQRRRQRGQHADHDRDLGALDRLGEHVAAEPVGAERQRLGLDRLDGAELARSPRPTRHSAAPADRRRRCRGSGRRVPGSPALAVSARGPTKRRRRIRHADLVLPAGGDQPERRGDHQQAEADDDQQRDHAHPVAAEAPPRRAPRRRSTRCRAHAPACRVCSTALIAAPPADRPACRARRSAG